MVIFSATEREAPGALQFEVVATTIPLWGILPRLYRELVEALALVVACGLAVCSTCENEQGAES
jgi:hypothetical protein